MDAAVRARPTAEVRVALATLGSHGGDVSEGARIDCAVRDLVHRLGDATSDDDVIAALGAMGAVFDMPNIHLRDGRRGDERAKGRVSLVVRPGMRRTFDALERSAFFDSLGAAREPMSLQDTKRGVESEGANRSSELDEIEALAVNLVLSDKGLFQVVFFGRQGIASGLAKSALCLSAFLASRCSLGPRRRRAQVHGLTEREREVLTLARSGLTDAKIGRALGIATRTVRFHLANAKRKAGVKGRAHLISKTSQLG